MEGAPTRLILGVRDQKRQNRNHSRGCGQYQGHRALQVVRLLYDGGYGHSVLFVGQRQHGNPRIHADGARGYVAAVQEILRHGCKVLSGCVANDTR